MKQLILITVFLIIFIVIFSIITYEEIYDINFYTSMGRHRAQIMKIFTLKTEYRINQKVKSFFDEQELSKMPDRWETIANVYKNIHGRQRSKDGLGMTVMKIIDYCTYPDTPLSLGEKKIIRSALIKYISCKNERKKSWALASLHIIVSEKKSDKKVNLSKELQRIEIELSSNNNCYKTESIKR